MKKLLISFAIIMSLGVTGCGSTSNTTESNKKKQLLYMVDQVKSIDKKKDISGEYRIQVLNTLKTMDTSKSEEYVKNVNKEMIRLLEVQVNYKPAQLFEETNKEAEQANVDSLIDLDKLVHEVETVSKDMK